MEIKEAQIFFSEIEGIVDMLIDILYFVDLGNNFSQVKGEQSSVNSFVIVFVYQYCDDILFQAHRFF